MQAADATDARDGSSHERPLLKLALSLSMATLLSGAFSACFLLTEPFPRNAVPLTPPVHYGLWWRMVESCSGLSGNLAAVQWYVQPGVETLQGSGLSGSDYTGFWFSSENRILLTESSEADGPLVRHEMLHALIGRGGHPRLYFRQRCGGIVACDGECATDGGPDPLPPSGAPVIDVRDLLVSAHVEPAVDSGGANGDWVALVISAQNPRPDAVWVRLATEPGRVASETFGYAGSRNYEFNFFWVYGDSIAFQGGETRRLAIDISDASLTFPVRPFFNIDTLATMPLVTRP